MTWAILGLLIVALTITLFWVFRLTVTVSKMSSNALAVTVSFDQRAQAERQAHREQVQGLVDRIMSMDWEAVRLHEGIDDTEPGGFFTPQEQHDASDEVTIIKPGGWGSGSSAQGNADLLDEVQSLAEQDDLDGHLAESGS